MSKLIPNKKLSYEELEAEYNRLWTRFDCVQRQVQDLRELIKSLFKEAINK